MEQKMIENQVLKVAEIELVYKTKVKASDRPKITCSNDAYKLLMETWDENKIEFIEQFKILLLNRGNRVLGIYENSTGGICGTVADIRLIFAAAFKSNAVNIMLCHNHPSSNLKPSRADDELTAKIAEAGRFLDIRVLDHLIVCKEGYYSYADEGVL
ncbi:MAG: JAB domain-containing protein [Sphingobacteriales bacterium]|nr:JAB domain-containing protein [Sphingobacteriales bacterium]OJW01228.1 MAG: DNA repair protein [Sphingobacteriales bacterium 44-61]